MSHADLTRPQQDNCCLFANSSFYALMSAEIDGANIEVTLVDLENKKENI